MGKNGNTDNNCHKPTKKLHNECTCKNKSWMHYTGRTNLAESKLLRPSAATQLPNHARIKLIETTILPRCNIHNLSAVDFFKTNLWTTWQTFFNEQYICRTPLAKITFFYRKTEFRIYTEPGLLYRNGM